MSTDLKMIRTLFREGASPNERAKDLKESYPEHLNKKANALAPTVVNTSAAAVAGAVGVLDSLNKSRNLAQQKVVDEQIRDLKRRSSGDGVSMLEKAELQKLEVESKINRVRRKHPKVTAIMNGVANATLAYGLTSAAHSRMKGVQSHDAASQAGRYKIAHVIHPDDLLTEFCVKLASEQGGQLSENDILDVVYFLDSEKVAAAAPGKEEGFFDKIKPYIMPTAMLAGGALAHRLGSKFIKSFKGDMDKMRHMVSQGYGVDSADAIKHFSKMTDDHKAALKHLSKNLDHGDIYKLNPTDIKSLTEGPGMAKAYTDQLFADRAAAKAMEKGAGIDFDGMDPVNLGFMEMVRPDVGQAAGAGLGATLGTMGARALGAPPWLGGALGLVGGVPSGEFVARSTMEPEKQIALRELEERAQKTASARQEQRSGWSAPALLGGALALGAGGYGLYRGGKALFSKKGKDVVDAVTDTATSTTKAAPKTTPVVDTPATNTSVQVPNNPPPAPRTSAPEIRVNRNTKPQPSVNQTNARQNNQQLIDDLNDLDTKPKPRTTSTTQLKNTRSTAPSNVSRLSDLTADELLERLHFLGEQ